VSGLEASLRVSLSQDGRDEVHRSVPFFESYAASATGLLGCRSQGATVQEALENIKEALREYLEGLPS
jgi:hypothetical protein